MMKRDEAQYDKDVTFGYFSDLLGAQKKLKCQRYRKEHIAKEETRDRDSGVLVEN